MASQYKMRIMRRSPSFDAVRAMRRTGQEGIFPFYHTAGDGPEPWISQLYQSKSSAEFEKDIDWLCSRFTPMTLAAYLAGERTIGGKPAMVLSFDDGLRSCSEVIAPILDRKGIPAVFFINNNFVGNKELFYRFKVSLLLSELGNKSAALKKDAARLLGCEPEGLQESLLAVQHGQSELLDKLAELCGFSFAAFLEKNPIYMDAEDIRDLLKNRFEIGAHSEDHPLFSALSPAEMTQAVQRSTERLCKDFNIKERYFAFPFTDAGVPREVIDGLFREGIIDAGFGTAGMRPTGRQNYFQRIPMELGELSAEQIIGGEFFYLRLKQSIFLRDRK